MLTVQNTHAYVNKGESFSFEDAELFNGGGLAMGTLPVRNPTSSGYPSKFVRKGSKEAAKCPLPSAPGAYRDETGASFMDLEDILNDEPTAPQQKSQFMDLDDILNMVEDAPSEKPKTFADAKKQAMVDLFDDLIQGYAQAQFQEELEKLLSTESRRQFKKLGGPLAHCDGRNALCLKVQKEVLPKHNYMGTKLGLHSMHRDAGSYTEDEDMIMRMTEVDTQLFQPLGTTMQTIRSVAIVNPMDPVFQKKDRLDWLLENKQNEVTVANVEEPQVEETNMKKQRLLDMLDELLEGFGEEAFQAKLRKMVETAMLRQNTPEGEPMTRIDGRQQLCLQVQRQVLPKYGFLGSKLGIYSMFVALEPFSKDEDMIEKMTAMDTVLGLRPNTTIRDIRTIGSIEFQNLVAVREPCT